MQKSSVIIHKLSVRIKSIYLNHKIIWLLQASTCALSWLLFSALASLNAARSLNEVSMTEMHDQWMAHYGRVYTDADEKNRRSTIFQQNLKYIHTFNKANSKPYKLGFNEFADLTDEEFTKSRNRFKNHICATSTNLFRYENVTVVPFTMDWRN